jgi:hydroxyacylglutathione hydrolase
MPLDIRLAPCLSDNYMILARDAASGAVATIDTPDADAVLAFAAAQGWAITHILNTHWHPDHAGGNAAIKEKTGAVIHGPQEVTRIAPLDHALAGGEVVMLGETRLRVLAAPGHTLGHIVYVSDADHAAFVGDVMFALGCGRLFEGTAAQMHDSLSALAALPDETRIYCAHEYTASNARFALSIDKDPAVVARAAEVFAARERNEATVPTTIGLEKATNPFLRAALLASAAGYDGADPVEAFAAVRAAKDSFKG